MNKDKRVIVFFILPALILFLLIFVYPVIRTAIMSFFSIDNITSGSSDWNFCGINNYIHLAQTPLFRSSLIALLKIWIVGGSIVMTFSLIFAVILGSGIKGKKFFRVILFLPYLISAIAMATMWQQYIFDNRFGLLKDISLLLGWKWLDPNHVFWAMLIAYCFGMVGYHTLIFLSGIEGIGQEYYEASKLDGATKIQQFRYITFPMLRGTRRTNLIMWSVSSISFFVWSQIFGNTGSTPPSSLVTPMMYMYMQTFGATQAVTERNVGLGAAVGVFSSLFVLISFLLITKTLSDDGLEY